MSTQDSTFAGSIPEIYDRYMVPLVFEAYAEDLARRVVALDPGDVLETAAGSGVVTRALAPSLGAGVRYTVTDLNAPMIDRARSQQPLDDRLTWQQADALDLPFGDAAFDVVLCQFGAMFFPDRPAGFREARRVLRPGGRLIFNVWDRIAQNVFADVVTEAVAGLFPDDPPRFLARTPHGYNDPGQLRADVKTAGFAHVEVDTVTLTSHAPDARFVAIAKVQGTPLRNEIESRDPARLAEATDTAEAALIAAFGSGAIEGQIQAMVVTAHD